MVPLLPRITLLLRAASRPKSVHLVLVAGALWIADCGISEDQELALGAADAAKVDSELPLIHDSAVTQYIATLGHSMASRTSRSDLDWHFAVVNSSEVNAFALPGGFIDVNRGAIEQADREDELAGIMGHEIGHVVRRHSVKQLEKREKGDVALVMLCTLTRACRTVGGQVAIDVGASALAAHYSQRDEAEADSEGVINTVRAGRLLRCLLPRRRCGATAQSFTRSSIACVRCRLRGRQRSRESWTIVHCVRPTNCDRLSHLESGDQHRAVHVAGRKGQWRV